MNLINILFHCITISGAYVPEDLKDSYIIVLKKGVSSVREHISNYKLNARMNDDQLFQIGQVFDSPIMKGYSGKFDKSTLKILEQQDEVEYIEQDKPVHASSIQKEAPWGLARVSSNTKLNLTDHKYHHDPNAGKGVNVYVIDTGININHPDFEGRAEWGITTDNYKQQDDGNGHGTHVAGTIGGKTYGVSKKAKLIAVKVLNDYGDGTDSGVIKGIEWAVAHSRSNGGIKGNVANMSLGGDFSRVLNDVVKAASEYMSFVVAAGNEEQDSCNFSPSSEPSAITVAASTKDDKMAWFSNFGPCVDLIAPGKDILSAWIGSKKENTISGTSMASPHVAGIVAYYLSIAKEKVDVKNVQELLIKSAGKDKIEGFSADTKNLLVNNGFKSTY